jgi:hypothetical protein
MVEKARFLRSHLPWLDTPARTRIRLRRRFTHEPPSPRFTVTAKEPPDDDHDSHLLDIPMSGAAKASAEAAASTSTGLAAAAAATIAGPLQVLILGVDPQGMGASLAVSVGFAGTNKTSASALPCLGANKPAAAWTSRPRQLAGHFAGHYRKNRDDHTGYQRFPDHALVPSEDLVTRARKRTHLAMVCPLCKPIHFVNCPL